MITIIPNWLTIMTKKGLSTWTLPVICTKHTK